MQHDRCPACDRPFALVGRVHRCVPRSGSETEVMQGRAARSARVAHNHEVGGSNPPPATNFQMEGYPAGTQAIGAHQSAMCETPPSTGEAKHLRLSANRGDTNIPGGGAAGGARGHMVVISSGNTLYAGNGGYGGRAVRTVSRGLILPGQALVIIVGSGAGAGAAGSNDGQYISQSGASAGAAGAVYISWT